MDGVDGLDGKYGLLCEGGIESEVLMDDISVEFIREDKVLNFFFEGGL